MICVEGVECMNDDPTAVDILYAKVFLSDNSDRSYFTMLSVSVLCTLLTKP